MCSQLASFLGLKHHVIIPYHPQANGIVERRNAEVMKHLRAVVMEKRVQKEWSLHLPIVQGILNSSFDFSIGTFPARVIFGDRLNLGAEYIFKKHKDVPVQELDGYVLKLQESIQLINEASGKYLEAKAKLRVTRREKLRRVEFMILRLGSMC